MSDPAMDVVEFALREHYGASEARDVTWRVLTAVRSPEGTGNARRSGPPLGLAAAVLLAVATGAFLLWNPGPPDARSSVALAVHDASGAATSTADVPAGRIAHVPAAARVELPGGATFEATAGTVFRWQEGAPALEVFAGAVDVQAPDEGIVVGSPTGTLELAAHGRARFEVSPAPDPLPRNHLARSLAMNLRTASLPTVTATLLAGSATLLCGGPPHPLALAQPSTVDPAYGAEVRHVPEDDQNPFAQEPGVWELFEPHDAPESTGVETVQVGPHPHSLLSDMASHAGGRERAVHWVLKYEAANGRITGSMLDNFGGPIGILRGELDGEGGRVLELYRIDGEPFGLRQVMRWVGDDERRTLLQAQEDGEWRTALEVGHRRRTEPVPDER